MSDPAGFFVYILECRDNSLYTGFTTDIARRLRAHASGRGSRYTRGRLPVRLVYWEPVGSRGEALRREAAIKGLTKSAKEELIRAGRARALSLPHADR